MNKPRITIGGSYHLHIECDSEVSMRLCSHHILEWMTLNKVYSVAGNESKNY